MMNRILILFAHPVFERSRAHRELIREISGVTDITIHDLYEDYPEFDIDIDREKELMVQHDIIVWQHPIFWYSGPALLKQWIDLVLEHGWAYGNQGFALNGKKIFNAITSGTEEQAYTSEGIQRSTVKEFLLPFERTAQLCRMQYLPPFWMPGTNKLDDDTILEYARRYKKLLTGMRDNLFGDQDLGSVSFLNDLVVAGTTK